MERVEINESGLLLRPWAATDAAAVHRACQDPDIQRWTSVPTPYLREHAIDFVTVRATDAWAQGYGTPFAVCDAETGELLGSCGLVTIDHRLRSGEIGYWTAPWARGRGVTVRATRAVCRWAFEQLGLRRIIWQAALGNHASRLVALRAGFRVEGRLRRASTQPGESPDGWIGSLLPADLAPTPGADPTQRPGGGAMAGRRSQLAGPGSMLARRAAVFGRDQPVLFATVQPGSAGEVRLRAPEPKDVPEIVTACRDPETVRWVDLPDPYLTTDAEGFVTGYAPTLWAGGDGAVFTIADHSDRYAGTIALRLSPADPAVADVGVLVAPHARGRGHCAAALAAVSAWGCTSLGLARIEWKAQVGNLASRRAAERAGFVIEGVARGGLSHRGTRRDAWLGAFLPGAAGPVTPAGGRTE